MRILVEFDNNPLSFENPERVITCCRPEDLPACLIEIERCLKDGAWVAGFVSYEAGYALEPKLLPHAFGDFPLLTFGCYRAPVPSRLPSSARSDFLISGLESNLSREEFFADIDRIRSHIEIGDVYQITFCRKLKFSFSGDAYALYCRLLRDQPVPYPAYIETDRYKILSLSPEMFLKKHGCHIETNPMKGSWPLGRGVLRDAIAGVRLHFDKKNRAENVMIADLLRNDLGRVGDQVRTPRLFEVARYRTICQMTSTVTARVPEQLTVERLFRAVFPSGSVTGAPKVRAMGIIRSLEKEERKIYTGAIGFITPSRDMFFNVPIRTILLDGAAGELGIGGGIVWDSTPKGEWDEGEWKARFFTDLD